MGNTVKGNFEDVTKMTVFFSDNNGNRIFRNFCTVLPTWTVSYRNFCTVLPTWTVSYRNFCTVLPTWTVSYPKKKQSSQHLEFLSSLVWHCWRQMCLLLSLNCVSVSRCSALYFLHIKSILLRIYDLCVLNREPCSVQMLVCLLIVCLHDTEGLLLLSYSYRRSQWSRGRMRAAHLMGLRLRIMPGAMDVCV